jgi:NitT/TauT family transport system substrate-binding protein
MELMRVILASMLLTAVNWAAAQTESLKVKLDFLPSGAHAPFHLAAQKGWFRQAGLDIEAEDGKGSVTTVQLVGGGNFDVGHASLASMMIGRDKGMPVRAIANFLRRNDIGLLVPRGTNRSPSELPGKKIIFTSGSLEAPFLEVFLAAGGLKREQVELLNVEAAVKVPTYAASRGDGVFTAVWFTQPLVEASRPSDAIHFSDHGLQFPSFGLFATEEKIRLRARALRQFASIVSGAWQYVIDGHEDEAVQAIIAQRPQAKLDPKILRAQIGLLRNYFSTPASKGMPMGMMADADWAAGIKTMAS